MAGTLGLKAAMLSLILLQILLCATFPELSKTLDALEIAVPSLVKCRQNSWWELFQYRASHALQTVF